MNARPEQFDDLHAKWRVQLSTLWGQVVAVHHHRMLWNETRDALVEAAPSSGFFLSHYAALYVAHQSMAVRRIADPNASGKTISLGGLLQQIFKNPAVLSRDRYVCAYVQDKPNDDTSFFRNDAIGIYDEHFGSAGELSVEVIDQLRIDLRAASRSVATYSSKVVAHIDTNSEKIPAVTYATLDEAINEIGRVFGRLSLLVDGSEPLKYEPTIQGDWKAPLRSALFESFPGPRKPAAPES